MSGIIEVSGLVKVYEAGDLRVEALRGVDLEIEHGEMVAIMGPSGCGKTTLLNTLSGIDDITAGEVLIDGTSIHDMPDKERTRYRAQSMGFVFQSFNLLPVLSGVENVELPLLLGGMPQVVKINSEPKYGWSTTPVVFSINHDEFGKIGLKTEIYEQGESKPRIIYSKI